MARHFLTIEDGQLKDYVNFDEPGVALDRAALDTVLNGDDAVCCSSSIDFPEEYNPSPEVMAMVEIIRRAI